MVVRVLDSLIRSTVMSFYRSSLQCASQRLSILLSLAQALTRMFHNNTPKKIQFSLIIPPRASRMPLLPRLGRCYANFIQSYHGMSQSTSELHTDKEAILADIPLAATYADAANVRYANYARHLFTHVFSARSTISRTCQGASQSTSSCTFSITGPFGPTDQLCHC